MFLYSSLIMNVLKNSHDFFGQTCLEFWHYIWPLYCPLLYVSFHFTFVSCWFSSKLFFMEFCNHIYGRFQGYYQIVSIVPVNICFCLEKCEAHFISDGNLDCKSRYQCNSWFCMRVFAFTFICLPLSLDKNKNQS